MNEVILVVLSIVGIIIALSVLYSIPSAFLKKFEKSCYETIKKRDEELEEKAKLNRELRKWFFG